MFLEYSQTSCSTAIRSLSFRGRINKLTNILKLSTQVVATIEWHYISRRFSCSRKTLFDRLRSSNSAGISQNRWDLGDRQCHEMTYAWWRGLWSASVVTTYGTLSWLHVYLSRNNSHVGRRKHLDSENCVIVEFESGCDEVIENRSSIFMQF